MAACAVAANEIASAAPISAPERQGLVRQGPMRQGPMRQGPMRQGLMSQVPICRGPIRTSTPTMQTARGMPDVRERVLAPDPRSLLPPRSSNQERRPVQIIR
jgi:hypothetical protein